MNIDKRIQNYFIIILLSVLTFEWTFWILHQETRWDIIGIVIVIRLLASTFIYRDSTSSWSKSSPKTFLTKSLVYLLAFAIYMPILYKVVPISFFISELFSYLFIMNLLVYSYYYIHHKTRIVKSKTLVIYGAGEAGVKLGSEFTNSAYKLKYYIDDNVNLQKRSIDNVEIISQKMFRKKCKEEKLDLLVIAIPSAPALQVKEIYNALFDAFDKIQVLPSLEDIFKHEPFSAQLKDISVEELLARYPKDLDKEKISSFIKEKTILITGAGGSIGSELVRKCIEFKAKKLILLDNSEYNLYQIEQEVKDKIEIVLLMQSVVDREALDKSFREYQPQIVMHAAAYKHVPMVEKNQEEGIRNNIIGTKNCIDLSIKYEAEKFIFISTDKAVRPTSVMGATKRIGELYAQNCQAGKTEIVAVRFGNVLGSSGSVIPKFKAQIQKGEDLTVTHPDMTRYFMLIPEACELVLQAGAIGKGGEIFILDMGEPIKIIDLANKMINLSGRDDIKVKITGIRTGEKLYEELLLDENDMHTQYDSITVGSMTKYDIETLNEDIQELIVTQNKLKQLQYIVPEFKHFSGQ